MITLSILFILSIAFLAFYPYLPEGLISWMPILSAYQEWPTILTNSFFFLSGCIIFYPILGYISHKKRGIILWSSFVELMIIIAFIIFSTGKLPPYWSGGTSDYEEIFFISVLGFVNAILIIAEIFFLSIFHIGSEISKVKSTK